MLENLRMNLVDWGKTRSDNGSGIYGMEFLRSGMTVQMKKKKRLSVYGKL